ncbi:NahK/ErcS family hybrid sensor histidine kinase/response regulator [Oceanobacter sp. 4_MG-2023]|uniref:PAS domain-containing hybrid sensor histidine kinase/response regulator n=1 Tax=Oceanobacter sp. 4_MG-2023 TaxID=3062623 RepID=UPI0027355A1C|nr:NahK/ErcS family hybrid sensor histidine kinase/response regulator [Oceanobacter sp. 4_MG-2023]MDP2547298.1 NahK/ErcS family hybrid sensor histidine kinase/response regulator [Oceanobacter sp. 4_MG-2023]
MRKRYDPASDVNNEPQNSNEHNAEDQALVQNLIGLGAFSARKSYYPELLQKIDELESEKERYQWLFENALHGIFQARASGGISGANPAIARMCGYRDATEFRYSVTSLRHDLFHDPQDLDTLMQQVNQLGRQQSFETRFKRKLGMEPVAVSINVLLKDPQQGLIEVFVHDITERKRAQAAMARINNELEQRVEVRTRELQAAKQEAEAANASKDKYLAAASHDLLQPMNAARLLVATLQERTLDNDNRVLVERIHTALTGAEELLADLLDISRLDANAVTPDHEEFAVNDLLKTLYSEFQTQAHQANLELHMVPSSLRIRSDPRLLMRILRNFVSNAIRYTPTGRVLIGCRRRGDQLQLMICDSGPGIAEHQRTEIFREFRQLDNANQGRSKGVGLGLAIVERIARMMDHPVAIHSRVGIGSCFSVTVPQASADDPQGRHSANRADTVPEGLAASARLNRVRVLVIDNEETIRLSMKSLLQAWGCNVITASNGEVAQDAWHNFCPDIVLADYHLDHDETGTGVIRTLAAADSNVMATPLIVITADRSDTVRQEITRLGATRLNKPVKPAKLRALMAYLLEQ